MKKLFKIFLISLMTVCLCGCHSQVLTTKKIDYQQVELSNIENDKAMLEKASKILDKNYNNSSNGQEKQVSSVKYLDDVYQIASNRVNLDLDILEVYSQEYKDYVATMQAYSEVYLKERSQLVKNSNLSEKNNIRNTGSGKILEIINQTIEKYIKK